MEHVDDPAMTAYKAPLPHSVEVVQVNLAVSGPDVFRAIVATAEAKLHASYFKLAVMGLLAGFYVSFGFSFCAVSIGLMGNTIYGALAFPTGLLLIVLCGAELFTGNCCYMFCANIEGKANAWDHMKVIWSSYFWNLVGSLIIVGLELGGDVWLNREDYIHNLAHHKMNLSRANVLCRAIIANWLVNLAVYQAFCARDVMGKAIGVWTPITAFVAIGLEHCIANMYIIPMSIYLPPTAAWPQTITWAQFISHNLIPATIGNWIGGAIMVGVFYGAVYGNNIPKYKDQLWDKTLGRVIKKLP
jgi:formate/nitrite transporter